jgi:hypothetical protein
MSTFDAGARGYRLMSSGVINAELMGPMGAAQVANRARYPAADGLLMPPEDIKR